MSSNEANVDGYENPFLSKKLRKLYLDVETADVFFLFDDNVTKRERIPAHKNLLILGSDAFKAMFYGDLKEKGDVLIVDATVAAFKELLQFFYHDKVKLTIENIHGVVYLGKKYDVDNCLDICEQFLMDSITNENACFCYGLAILFDLTKLKKVCETVIAENSKAIFRSSSFLECDRSVLGHILKFNTLSCEETQVFHACMAWVKAATKEGQVNKDAVDVHLGDLFYEIRFGSMTFDEFTALRDSYDDLFSFEGYQDIVRMIVSKDYYSNVFKKNSRQIQWNERNVVNCYHADGYGTKSYSFQEIESTTLSTNKSVLLGEIVCAQINRDNYYNGKEYPVEVTVIERSEEEIPKILSHNKTVLQSGSGKVILMQPVLMKPKFVYEILFKQTTNRTIHVYANAPRTKAEIPNTDIIIQFHNASTSRGSIISSLGFNKISRDEDFNVENP